MKRAIACALAGICLLSGLFLSPGGLQGGNVSECYSNHSICRAYAFEMDCSWFKMALALTVCDIALGKCILKG
jgi:hypothetical protein